MAKPVYGFWLGVLLFVFLSMSHVWGAEKDKDAYSFEYTFELNEDGSCHVTVVETITFYEHYVGNPDFLAEFQADAAEAQGGGFAYCSGPGSGGQKAQMGSGKYSLIEYLHYLVWNQYNPCNFKTTDSKTGKRLNVTERSSGEYTDFFIEIGDYIGEPEKGDTYTLIIEYDTENRVEPMGNGRYAFSFYREGSGESGLCEYAVSIELPPYYEYEASMVADPSGVSRSRVSTVIHYRGEHIKSGSFEFKMQYHYPVGVFVEEGKSLLEKGNYSGALKKFEEAKKRYQNLGKKAEVSAVNSLISQSNQMEQAEELFARARTQFSSGEFAAAQQLFQDVVSRYGSILTNQLRDESDSYIEICSQYVRAQELEQQAEDDIRANLWESAISNLQEAKSIYAELGDDDRVSWIEERIVQVQKDAKEEDLQSQLKMFIVGSAIIIGGLVIAFFSHSALKTKRTEIDIQDLLESPDVPEEVKRFLEEKVGWRRVPAHNSQKQRGELIEKLRKGKETLNKMFTDGLISEKEHGIAMEEIESKIAKLEENNWIWK